MAFGGDSPLLASIFAFAQILGAIVIILLTRPMSGVWKGVAPGAAIAALALCWTLLPAWFSTISDSMAADEAGRADKGEDDHHGDQPAAARVKGACRNRDAPFPDQVPRRIVG
ncbi:hypothetical protein KY084_05315 [Stakelama sp. CBK3Z-3]|uniref:Uncharacterized protein n=1 Tax=Stakelama flava TaxID=2860338 RepID=A0ABS6XJB0_9SPHN|nr:hypothetical protein [Stakelama flava]MBW4330290.1 hypothetical protein [Stakelama flava]